MRPLRQKLSFLSLGLGFCTAVHAGPFPSAQPVWSRTDTGIASSIAANGQIAQAHGEIDSAWIRVLNPNGQVRWTAGLKIASQAPSHTPSLKALVPTPDGGWIAAFDRSYTNLTSSALYRFDSLGRSVGSTMSFQHDTALYLSVVAVGQETWAAAKVASEHPQVVHRFEPSGSEFDSLELANFWAIQELFAVGNHVLVHLEHPFRGATCATFALLGTPVSDPGGRTTRLWQDSVFTMSYTSRIVSMGASIFAYVTDSGTLDVAKGQYPRVRVVTWKLSGDRLVRAASITTDLVSAADAWATADGKLRLIGTRHIPGSSRFEPIITTLDANATIQAKAVQPDAAVTNTLTSVFGAHYPDGSAFLGVRRLDNTVAVTLLDAQADSMRTLDIAPQGAVGLWYAQPDGSILSLRHSSNGGTITLEDWNTTSTAAVSAHPFACKSLRSSGAELVLDLDQPSRQARLDIVDLRGRILSSRDLGSLEVGRHIIAADGTGLRIARLQLDGIRLIAKLTRP